MSTDSQHPEPVPAEHDPALPATGLAGDHPAGEDVRSRTDRLRADHRVVTDERGGIELLRHDDVVAVARDADRFSSAVSRFLQVPNGLDGELHAATRATLDKYLNEDAVREYEPAFRQVARDLFTSAPLREPVDAVNDLGARFAVRAQSAWLGWSTNLEPTLLEWMDDNHAATRSGDLARTADVAERFDTIITALLDERRTDPRDDITTSLLTDEVHDTDGPRRFTDAELVSILRNWTGGDLGSIALCVGVVFHFLATHPDVQQHLRSGVPDAELDAAVDEILRIDDPFVSNRRKAVCPAHAGGVDVQSGQRVTINWTSANRDEEVFGDPDAFRPAENAAQNLVYGIGAHVCPGRPLATLELRVAVQEALAATTSITLSDRADAVEREEAPVGGFSRVLVELA